jgi:secreted trypsin-like serine protease
MVMGGRGGITILLLLLLSNAAVFRIVVASYHSSDGVVGGNSKHLLMHDQFYDANRRLQSAELLAEAIRSSSMKNNDEGTSSNNAQQKAAIRKRISRRKQHRRKASTSDRKETEKEERDLIVNGSTAPPGRFPYSVSLQLESVNDNPENNGGDELNNVHTCGGTLISPDVVLTAGHCGYEELGPVDNNNNNGQVDMNGNVVNFGENPKQLFFGADVGAYNIQNGYSGSSSYEVDNLLFEKLLLHPEYTGFYGSQTAAGDGNSELRLQHDVMLVKLYGESNKPFVKIHNPNTDDDPTDGEELVVIGWGDTNPDFDDPDLPDILQFASVNYVSNDMCEESSGQTYIGTSDQSTYYFEYDGKVSNDMMCAVDKDGQDACQGDSGGGLIRLGSDRNGKDDVQLGIVSWGLACGDPNFPGVYSRVAEHYDWIRDNVCELSDKPPDYMNCPYKPYPPGNMYSAPVEIQVTIRFDEFPGESGWLLESIPDFRNIVFKPFGSYSSTSLDNSGMISETVRVQSGRFYLLTLMDEFADGFCCKAGKGFFRVETAHEEQPLVPTTLGLLWSKHSLRRAFYVSEPASNPPVFVTIVLTLGFGSDPSKFLYFALESLDYEAMMLYELYPLIIANDSRDNTASSGGGSGATSSTVYSQVYKVPVFDVEFGELRYNVIAYDDNEGMSKASFEVYLGDASPDNLLLAQSGNYGDDRNNIVRSFVLFKDGISPSSLPDVAEDDAKNVGATFMPTLLQHFLFWATLIFYIRK